MGGHITVTVKVESQHTISLIACYSNMFNRGVQVMVEHDATGNRRIVESMIFVGTMEL